MYCQPQLGKFISIAQIPSINSMGMHWRSVGTFFEKKILPELCLQLWSIAKMKCFETTFNIHVRRFILWSWCRKHYFNIDKLKFVMWSFLEMWQNVWKLLMGPFFLIWVTQKIQFRIFIAKSSERCPYKHTEEYLLTPLSASKQFSYNFHWRFSMYNHCWHICYGRIFCTTIQIKSIFKRISTN